MACIPRTVPEPTIWFTKNDAMRDLLFSYGADANHCADTQKMWVFHVSVRSDCRSD